MSGTMTRSFVGELGKAIHALNTDNIYCAFYSDPDKSVITKDLASYTATNEAATAGDYSAGGVLLTTSWVSGTVDIPYLSIQDIKLDNVSWTAIDTALLYNASQSNRTIALFRLDRPYTIAGGSFILRWPTNDSASALIRIKGVKDG